MTTELAAERPVPAWRAFLARSLLEDGDTIPADARLVESTAIQTAESALMGDSLPVFKVTTPIADEVALSDRHNMVFSGTAAT